MRLFRTIYKAFLLATLAGLGYVAFLFNFFGVNLWISGLHSYAGV